MARIAAGPAGEERRLQILAAALRVFADKGYKAATTKDIATEAGVTAGLIYHYFSDKRALLEAILGEHSPMSIAIEALGAENVDELDPHVFLPLFVMRLLEKMEDSEQAGPFHLLMGEAMHNPETRNLFNQRTALVVEKLTQYLQHQVERGRLRPLDPKLVAHLLLGSIMSCVIRRVLTKDQDLCAYSRTEIAATVGEMMLSGLEVRTAHEIQ